MENIVSGQETELQLIKDREIPKFNPQNVTGFQSVAPAPTADVPPVEADPSGGLVEQQPAPVNADIPYEQLVLGDMPQFQMEPQVGDWYAQQLAQQEQLQTSQFAQRVEQLNNLPGIPQFNNEPALEGYSDPRFLQRLMEQSNQVEQNVYTRANRYVNPEPPTAIDPNRPDLVLRALPNLVPGTDAAAARREGGYNPPIPNGWSNWSEQLQNVGRLAMDLFQPQTALRVLRGGALNAVEGVARLAGQITAQPNVRPGMGTVLGTAAEALDINRPEVINSTVNLLESIAPVQQQGNPINPYYFNPQQGYFGEMGRGLGGLALYGLALPGQIAMASVYSMTDLGRALTGNNPWEGVDPNELTGVRYRQAFAGQDLGFTNFRDGSGRRYLAAIDPNAPVAVQWIQGALGFAGDAFALGWVDDALWDGLRIGGRQAARLVVPNFVPQRFPGAPGAAAVVTPNVPDLPPSTGSVTLPSSVATTEFRSNDDLLALGRRVEFNGQPIVPPDVQRLSEDGRAMLQNVFGETFNRRGVTPDTSNLRTVIEAPTALREGGRLTQQLRQATTQAQQTAQSVGEFADTTNRVAGANSAMLNRALEMTTGQEQTIQRELHTAIAEAAQTGELPENVVELVHGYLRASQDVAVDPVTTAGREVREIEQRMVQQHETLRANQTEVAAFSRYGRGHIQDEIDNLLQHGDEAPLPSAQSHTRGLLEDNTLSPDLRPEEAEQLYLRVAPYADEVATQFPELSDAIRRTNNTDWISGQLSPSPGDMADEFLGRMGALDTLRNATVPDEFRNVLDELVQLGEQSVRAMWRNASEEARHAAIRVGLPVNSTPTIYGRALPDIVNGETFYHGSKIDYENFDNLHPEVGGSANELGAGLYLTDDPNIAELHALRGSNPTTIQNPTRRVSNTGNVYTVQAQPRNTLSGTERPPANVRKAFYQAATDVLGNEHPAIRTYKREVGKLPANQWWLRFREVVADSTGAAISEVDYRRFSSSVAERLRRRGYDSIRDGNTLVILDQPSRLPVKVESIRRGVGQGTPLEAAAAQAEADRLLRDRLSTPSTRAWAAQSQLGYEDLRMNELVDTHNALTANMPVGNYLDSPDIRPPNVTPQEVLDDVEIQSITQNLDDICP